MENSNKITQFKNLLNDPDISQQEKSDQLTVYVKELTDLKLSLQITTKERYRCMICQQLFFSNDDKFLLDSCDCLQIVHKACLKLKTQENFFEILSCYSCKIPISESVLKNFSNSINKNSNYQKPLNNSLTLIDSFLPEEKLNQKSQEENKEIFIENQIKYNDKPKKKKCKIF